MRFQTVIPILYSENILRSISYYTDILGFENKWDWGEPPTFGGVSKNSVEVFFCEKGQGHPGTWISVMVNEVDTFYSEIQARGAKILKAPQTMSWGLREMLVEDPDGHVIRFGQSAPRAGHDKTGSDLLSSVRIIAKAPGLAAMQELMIAVGWSRPGKVEEPIPASSIAFAVLAEETTDDTIIGCALLLTDHAGDYYVKNVIVHPRWQHRGVGTAMMKMMTDWMENNLPDHAFVSLHTGENLTFFYKQFGFAPIFSMHRRIRRNNKT